jgi:hypothetical protein
MMGQRHWSEGWIAARQTIQCDHEAFTPEVMARLRVLEASLQPRDLVEKVQSVVLREDLSLVDFEGFDFDAEKAAVKRGGYERAEQIAQTLGEAVARDDAAIRALLSRFVSGKGRLFSFGRGLGMACALPEDLWNRQLALTPEGNRNMQVLRGFLAGLNTRDPGLARALLDRAVEHDVLGPCFPLLQSSVPLDANGIARLTRALAGERAPIGSYQHLAYGRFTDPISGDRLRALPALIAGKPGGHDVAIEILSMRLHSDNGDHRPADPDLAAAGRALLAQLPFKHDDRDDGYRLKLVANAALTGAEGAGTARLLWRNFVAAVHRQDTHAFKQHGLLTALFSTQPAALLDEITAGDENTTQEMLRLLRDAGYVWRVIPSTLFPPRRCWHGAARRPPRVFLQPLGLSHLLPAVRTERPRNGHPQPKDFSNKRRTGQPFSINSCRDSGPEAGAAHWPRFWIRAPRFFWLLASTTTVILPSMPCVPTPTFNSKSRRKDSGKRSCTGTATNVLNSGADWLTPDC